MSFFLFLSETLKEFNEFVITDSSIKSQLEDLKIEESVITNSLNSFNVSERKRKKDI
jgi:hypothetical protein